MNITPSSRPTGVAPPSPSKKLLRTLLTGVTPTDPITHQKRWSRLPQPPPETSTAAAPKGKVANLVKDYEAASLVTTARQYTPAPPSPVRTERSDGSESPTVPASFFQLQQGRRTQHSSTPGGDKENVAGAPICEERRFSPTRPSPSARANLQVPPRGGGPERQNSMSSSVLSTRSSAESTTTSMDHAVVAHARVISVSQHPPALRPGYTPPTAAASRPISQPPPGTTRNVAQRQISPTFTEAIPSPPRQGPSSYPSRPGPPLPGMKIPSSASGQDKQLPVPFPPPDVVQDQNKDEEKTVTKSKFGFPARKRAQTLSSSSQPPSMPPPPNRSHETQPAPLQQQPQSISAAFSRLLDEMQLPPNSTVRTKMMGLPDSLKRDMLASQPSSSSTRRPAHARALSASVGPSSYPGFGVGGGEDEVVGKKDKKPFLKKVKSSVSLKSIDLGKNGGEDATYWAVRMRSASYKVLEPKEVGRLRGRLRGEAPSWVEEFLKHGGYSGMLDRLKELMDIEWREEQHDDQLLFELLKCFKALTLTSSGKAALASRSPTPFVSLASLLFSEKRPGDIPCRQLLVDLVHAVFEVSPSSAQVVTAEDWARVAPSSLEGGVASGGSGGEKRYSRPVKGDAGDTFAMVTSLMRGPPDEKEESKVGFIKDSHKPRLYKRWVVELSDCVRDYFWIFCHSQNQIWTYDSSKAEEIESPQVPSGMTGGVEYEAMAYCAAHFKLMNAIVSNCRSRKDVFEFHAALFQSGLERILLILRRASTTYYPILHLELARYVASARRVGFNLGPKLISLLERRTLSRDEEDVLRSYLRAYAGAPSAAPLQVVGRKDPPPQIGDLSFQ